MTNSGPATIAALALPPLIDPRLHPPDDAFLRLLPRRDGDRVALPGGLTYVFIVFTNRSGSTYLAELLASGGFFNRGDEVLNPEAAVLACNRNGWGSLSGYFAALAGRAARNGHFVLKATIRQLAVLDWHGVLPRIMPRSRFLVIERMDKLAQAISWSIANQTGAFNSMDRHRSGVDPGYDGLQVRSHLERVVEQQTQIDLFMALNGVVPFHLTYEALVADPQHTAQQACDYLGLPRMTFDPSRVQLERQATARNTAWRERFLNERARLVVSVPEQAGPPPSAYFRPATLAKLYAARRTLDDGGLAVQRLGYLPSALFEVPPHAYGNAPPQAAAGAVLERPAIPAWLLRDAVIHGKYGILTVGDAVVAESLQGVPLDALPGAGWDADGRFRLPLRRPAAPAAMGYHLLAGQLESYLHWLLDVVGRYSPTALAMLDGPAATAPVVLVPHQDVYWKWESVGLVVPEAVERRVISKDEQVAVARLLYVPDLGGGGVLPHPALLAVFDAVRREAIGGVGPAWRPSGRIYVARAANAGGPVPADEEALAARAARAGFVHVVPGELSVIEQARLFAQAGHIVAAPGADLANIAFCHPGAKLLELLPPGEPPPNPPPLAVRRLAALRGMHYGSVSGHADPANPDAWTIDLDTFAAVLADPAFRAA